MTNRRIGPFELNSKLGVGGMGIVYHATYVKTGQECALKVLPPTTTSNPQLIKRFEREMAILQKLRHKNIVHYFGGGKDGNQLFYAMELMDGGSLEDILKKRKKLKWEQAVDCGIHIARALEQAHYHGIIHRDLKPANVFLNKKGRLKLGDFGIARDTQATALTAAGKTVGTYAYMAPEQISGKHPISGKTDLYALGCVLFEMVSGSPPFQAETPAEMLFQHLQEEPQAIRELVPDCPVWLEAVIDKLLEKEPEDRYYDALATQVALEEVKQRVAENASVTKAGLGGDPTAVTLTAKQSEIARLVGKKKKKKKKKGEFVPVYERAWFLGLALVLLVGLVTYFAWPLSAEQLWERAQPLIQSDDRSQWITARENYLTPLVEKHPDSPYTEEAREFLTKMDVDLLERQALKRYQGGSDPESEAERLFIRAHSLAGFGDRIAARSAYASMVTLLEGRSNPTEDDQNFLRLARRNLRQLDESAGQTTGRQDFVNGVLRDADRLAEQGNRFEAEKKWRSIEKFYSDNSEFERHVEYARARLSGENVEPFDYGESESDDAERPETESEESGEPESTPEESPSPNPAEAAAEDSP